MSETQIFGLKKNKDTEKLVEFKNSHGYGTSIWLIYAWKYLGLNQNSNLITDEKYSQLWDLIYDDRLPFHDKVVLISTFDRSIIEKKNYNEFLKCLELWQKDHEKTLLEKNYVNHVKSLMLYMQKNKKEFLHYDYIGVQITNIMDCQYYVDWENEAQTHPVFEGDEDYEDEDRYYSSLTKISDMCEVFESLKGKLC